MSLRPGLPEIGATDLDGFEVWDRTVHAPAGQAKKAAFVTLRAGGAVGMNRAAYTMLPPCDAVKVMYDPRNQRLGIVPCDPHDENSYDMRLCDAGLSCVKLFEYYGINTTRSRRCYDVKVVDGVLIANLGGMQLVRPTARPWRVKRSDASIWIEGPQGSAPGKHPRQRRIVCEFKLYGDEALDAETEANLDLIVQRVNGE